MKRLGPLLLIILATAALSTLLFPPSAQANELGRRGRRHARPDLYSTRPVNDHPSYRVYSPYRDWSRPQLYPQFYGGFHYREIFNYGYPPGDIGLRGTAW